MLPPPRCRSEQLKTPSTEHLEGKTVGFQGNPNCPHRKRLGWLIQGIEAHSISQRQLALQIAA